MTTPGAEDDVVKRLRAEKIDLRIPEMPFCTERVTRPVCEEAAALIERLQKELMEARELQESRNEETYQRNITILSIRAKTIEECAKIAENFAEVTGKIDGGMKSATAAGMWNIAKAIRSLDGGGK